MPTPNNRKQSRLSKKSTKKSSKVVTKKSAKAKAITKKHTPKKKAKAKKPNLDSTPRKRKSKSESRVPESGVIGRFNAEDGSPPKCWLNVYERDGRWWVGSPHYTHELAERHKFGNRVAQVELTLQETISVEVHQFEKETEE